MGARVLIKGSWYKSKRGPPLGSFGWVYEQVRKDRALTGGDLEPRCEGTVAKKTLQTYVSKARGQLREEEKVSKPKG